MTEKRRKAIIRRRIFIAVLAFLLAVLIAVVSFVVSKIDFTGDNTSSDTTVNSSTNSEPDIPADNSSSETSAPNSSNDNTVSSKDENPDDNTLDADFSRLLLINANNPLPEDYDQKVREYLIEVDPQYRNNNYVTHLHKEIIPYVNAMVSAAQADGVDLRVWSPFRSYAIQNDLFQKQVNRVGGDEAKAATVVARPGTSEHNTGLCADFNMASDRFESTEMFTWMKENAENYGFILRYPKNKQHITGVIYESWHWRFVGINAAKEMNSLELTLEEYIEYKNLKPTVDMYTDDK